MELLKNDLLLKALRGENVARPPVWMMRQAGRYLPDYIKLRNKYDFFTRVQTPELAAEITLQPIEQVGVDAAIIFSGSSIFADPKPNIFDNARTDSSAAGNPAKR